MIKFTENNAESKKIVVLGVGRTGHGVIEKINTQNINDIKTYFIDSDMDTVDSSTASEKICVPNGLIKESVADGAPMLANQELAKLLKSFLEGMPKTDVVFSICGLGGGMGSTVIPIALQVLKEKSYWIWSLNSVPFFFEGKTKLLNSFKQVKLIQQYSNAVLVIPHDKIFKMVDKELSMKEAFTPAVNLCVDLIIDVYRLTSKSGINKRVNIKFSDFKDKLYYKKTTAFGFGEGAGQSRMAAAIEKAIASPLLGKEILLPSERIILNVSGSEGLKLEEVNKGMEFLHTLIPRDKNIIFGVTIDNKLEDKIRVDIIAIGTEAGSGDNWGLSLQNELSVKEGTPVQNGELSGRFSKLGHPGKETQKPKQTMIDFKKVPKGCFDKSEGTVFGGVDLDVPTFMRKKK